MKDVPALSSSFFLFLPFCLLALLLTGAYYCTQDFYYPLYIEAILACLDPGSMIQIHLNHPKYCPRPQICVRLTVTC
jgi:hypothetical protein